MVKPVINFMENYAPTPNRIYDLYQYYMGGGSNQPGTGGQTPPGYQSPIPGSGGGGIGALQVGSPMMNPQTFYKQGYDAFLKRTQPELFAKDTFFGFPTTRQDVNPVDAGSYLAAGMEVPTALTKAGMMQQKVAKAKTGITNMLSNFKGPITGILSAMDKFDTLPQLDQQFIERAMGYIGPTVFGENTGGGYKDPFGLNVRSAFGNYAEKAADIVDTLEAKLAKNGFLSNYDQTRLGHYKNVTKTKQDAVADLGLINLAKEQAEAKRQEALKKIQAQGRQDYNPNIHGPVNYGKDSQGNQSFDFGGGFGIGSDGGPVSNKTGRGRTGYSEGGLATMFKKKR